MIFLALTDRGEGSWAAAGIGVLARRSGKANTKVNRLSCSLGVKATVGAPKHCHKVCICLVLLFSANSS
jgi:hypothetical protein